MLQNNYELISFVPGRKYFGVYGSNLQLLIYHYLYHHHIERLPNKTILGKIIFHDCVRLQSEIIPLHFNHASYASLRRQLSYFSFVRVGKVRGLTDATYTNDNVIELSDILKLKKRLSTSSIAAAAGGNHTLESSESSEQQSDMTIEDEDGYHSKQFKPIIADNKTPVDDEGDMGKKPKAKQDGNIGSFEGKQFQLQDDKDAQWNSTNGSVGAVAHTPGVSASTPAAHTSGPTPATDVTTLPSRALNVVTPTSSLLDAKEEEGQLKKMGDDVQNEHLNHLERMIESLQAGMVGRLTTYVSNAFAKFEQSYEEITERAKHRTQVIQDDNNKLAIELGNLSFDTSQDNTAKKEKIRAKKQLNDSKLAPIKEEEARSKAALCKLYKSTCKDTLKEMSHQGRINVEDRITHLYTRLDNHFNKKA